MTADQLPAEGCRTATGAREGLEAGEARGKPAATRAREGEVLGKPAATRALAGGRRRALGLPRASANPVLKSAPYLSPLRSADLAALTLWCRSSGIRTARSDGVMVCTKSRANERPICFPSGKCEGVLGDPAATRAREGEVPGNPAATRASAGAGTSALGLPRASANPVLKSAAYLSPLRSADLAALKLWCRSSGIFTARSDGVMVCTNSRANKRPCCFPSLITGRARKKGGRVHQSGEGSPGAGRYHHR